MRVVSSPASVYRRYLHVVHELVTKSGLRDGVESLPQKSLPNVEGRPFGLWVDKFKAPVEVTLSHALKLIKPSTYLANVSPNIRYPEYSILLLKEAQLTKKP